MQARPYETPRRSDHFLVNALIGAVVTVVTSFVPFSPIIGGAVAGYLQKGTTRDGLRVGVVSGLLAALPILVVLTLVFGWLSVASVGSGEPAGAVLFGVILLFVVFVLGVFVVGVSGLGGVVGVALADRPDETRDRPDLPDEVVDETTNSGRTDRFEPGDSDPDAGTSYELEVDSFDPETSREDGPARDSDPESSESEASGSD